MDCPTRALHRSRCAYPRHPGIAGCAASNIPVVDNAIAIVIDVIADFRGRSIVSIADDGPGYTRRCARPACPGQPCGARCAAAGIALVNLTIAIVVDSVAGFRSAGIICIANNDSARARRRTRCAVSWQSRIAICAAAGIAIVNDPVAIVVDTVANFGALLNRWIADDRPARTCACA